MTLPIGTRIYNHGDQWASAHYGEIIGVRGDHYQIISDEGEAYYYPIRDIGDIDEGSAGERIVTETAHHTWLERRAEENGIPAQEGGDHEQ